MFREANENELESSQTSKPHFPPPRSPLNAITDPTQCQSSDYFDATAKDCNRSSNKKRIEGGSSSYVTPSPRVPGRSSAQRSGRFSLGAGARGAASALSACSRFNSRVVSSIDNCEFSTQVPHFELVEDAAFWTDHNVQVLIRIRPLNSMEKVSQGFGRCLRQESAQTLVWLGHPDTRFTFDHIACETISQENLFKVAGLPMVENCMSGYNSCMFAYGQTGSGKTYTMMGNIHEVVEGELNKDCGITPRMLEYLFSRIRTEEENRRDEKLKFRCKCSFLEIYNEQITDLLEPSSANLQLREDLKKGVYVENLTEHNVINVTDVIKLLLQGAAYRKMAATDMNSESSRSHSVFTCTIESHWEKDSMTHLRFARLNLVDLAGSERQKSSGAEGDRLKEAANINKSLSTLGLVIMSLVDLAHGKHRHVPYRDSRLTFLLQDSLGGNSKTTIIANVSPSTSSANETLSTLKFAQRAKLIQNNAKVNEDASGNVTALQRQIQLLKGQLSSLMKHHNFSRSISGCAPSFEESRMCDLSDRYDSLGERKMTDKSKIGVENKKIQRLEATLISSLRREKTAETKLQKLEAEIEHANCLACQREEDTQHIKMMLKFREEKIKQLELLVNGAVSAEQYFMQENNALKEEIQLLQARIDRNPEVMRFARENIRLLEQLQLFQNFYEQGERETLLAEVSELRDQLLEVREGKHRFPSRFENQDNGTVKELEDCRSMNSQLTRKVNELQTELRKYLTYSQEAFDTTIDSLSKDPEEIRQTDKYSLVETISIRSDSAEEIASYTQVEDVALDDNSVQKMTKASALQLTDTQKELTDPKLLIEAMESEQVHLIKELELVQEQNHRYREILSNKDMEEIESLLRLRSHHPETDNLEKLNKELIMEEREDFDRQALQARLEKLTEDLEEASSVNCQCQVDQSSQLSQQHEFDLVREEVEIETSRTILHLQEEAAALQVELHERLHSISQENARLVNTVAAQEEKIRTICVEWERATLELTSFLLDGSRSVKDASSQIESIACSFPRVNIWITDHVERAAKACIEKEEAILRLQKSLEDTQRMVQELEMKLHTLKGATMALSEFQHPDGAETPEELIQFSMPLNEKINLVNKLESKLKIKEDQLTDVERRAAAAFTAVKWLSDHQKFAQRNDNGRDIPMSSLETPAEMGNMQNFLGTEADGKALAIEDIKVQVELAELGVLEFENAIKESYADTEVHIVALQTDILEAASVCRGLVQYLLEEIQETRREFMELKEGCKSDQLRTPKPQTPEAQKWMQSRIQCPMLHQIKDQLAEANHRLNIIKNCIKKRVSLCGFPATDEDLIDADGSNADCSTSSSDFSLESVASGNISNVYACSSRFSGNMTEQILDLKSFGSLVLEASDQEPKKLEKPFERSFKEEAVTFSLRKELEIAYDSFNKLYIWLTSISNENDCGDCSCTGEINQVVSSSGLMMKKAEAECHSTRKAFIDEKIVPMSNFLGKFEEVHATMKEADFMLNALMKENENAKQQNGMWRKAGEELLAERASLIKEVEQLKSSIQMKGEENELLRNQIHCSLVDINESVSLFEGCSQQLLREVEDRFKVLYSDVVSMKQELLGFICNSRSSLEDIWSEIMKNEFSLFVQYQCHVGAFHSISNMEQSFLAVREQESQLVMNQSQKIRSSGQDVIDVNKGDQGKLVASLEDGRLDLSHNDLIFENLSLKKELQRKEVLFEGLLFDFSMLQESASNTKDIKDETEKLISALNHFQQELEIKSSQLDDLLVHQRKLDCHLTDTENALFISNSELEQAKETIDTLTDQVAEFKMLTKDLYLRKSEAEEQLEEHKEIVKGLEEEILHLNSLVENNLLSSVEGIEEDLKKVVNEKDKLQEEVYSLNEKLHMAYALADENEAIAVEARQESEASKVVAEQKEEEVKILEHSVQELESTINVLEKKVNEMDEEVERHRFIRNSLEVELQALRQRLSAVENLTDIMDSENSNGQAEDQTFRQLQNKLIELHEAHNQIRLLERERAEQDKEIKQCKEYISELVLHSEAQASQFQQKYKILETMVHEVKTDPSTSTLTAPTLDKAEKSSMTTRTRGSSSPFRCISSLVQQMNSEKDQELSMARLRIEELETLVASLQKEVCMLNTRLAAAESMTHDVIRDLLGVKLDMTNYANLIDQRQVQKLMEEAHQQAEEFLAKEQEALDLRKQIDDLTQERDSCISVMKSKEADILATQMTLEQLQERDQLLSAQNEMLKMDKSNLLRKVAELDEMVKTLLGTQITQQRTRQTWNMKEKGQSNSKVVDADFSHRLAHNEKLLSRVNNELDRYRKPCSGHPRDRTCRPSPEPRYR